MDRWRRCGCADVDARRCDGAGGALPALQQIEVSTTALSPHQRAADPATVHSPGRLLYLNGTLAGAAIDMTVISTVPAD